MFKNLSVRTLIGFAIFANSIGCLAQQETDKSPQAEDVEVSNVEAQKAGTASDIENKNASVSGKALSEEKSSGASLAENKSSEPVKKAEPSRPKFNIWEYRVEGNSLLDIQEIEKKIYPYLGLRKTIEDIEGARLALETLYKEQGFPTVIVNIPQQKIRKGIIKLEVVEGKVSRFRVSGARYFSISGIKKSLPSLKKGNVFDVDLTREEIKKLNSVSTDFSSTPVLKQGKKPGTLEVDLQVKDKRPVHGSIGLNNQNTASTTDLRAAASLEYSNLWQKFHTLSLFYQISPENTDEVNVFSGSYGLPVNNRRDRILFNLVQSDSDTFSTLPTSETNIVGAGQIYGLQYSARLPALDGYFHSLNVGVDYKDFDDNFIEVDGMSISVPASADEDLPDNQIDYWQFYLNYSGTFNSRKSTTRFSIAGTQGIGALNDQQEFLEKRQVTQTDGAIPNYFYFDASLSQIFKFKGWHASGSVKGRYTEDLLISNEQFSIGGVSTVRGYFESTHLGDRGYAAKLEIRTPNVFNRYRWSNHWFKLQFFTFYDLAEVGITIPTPEERDAFKLSSFGGGLEFVFARRFTGAAQWARALDDAFTTLSDDTRFVRVEQGDERFHFELKYEF